MSLTPPSRSELPEPSVVLLIIAIGVQALGMIWNSATRRAFKAAVTAVVSAMAQAPAEVPIWDRDEAPGVVDDAARARAYWLALMAKFPD
jgi:hypothetical protein